MKCDYAPGGDVPTLHASSLISHLSSLISSPSAAIPMMADDLKIAIV